MTEINMTNFADRGTAERYAAYMAKHKARHDAVMSYRYPQQYRDLVGQVEYARAVTQENGVYFQTNEFRLLPVQTRSRMETMNLLLHKYAGILYWRLSAVYDELNKEV